MSTRRPGPDTGRPPAKLPEKLPWWSRPVRIAIRVFAIAVIAVFVVLTVIQLLP